MSRRALPLATWECDHNLEHSGRYQRRLHHDRWASCRAVPARAGRVPDGAGHYIVNQFPRFG
jgi:hypothetical protein